MRMAPAVPGHATHAEELTGAAVRLPPGGVVLGSGQDGVLVVRLFRAQPVRLCIHSAGQLAQLIAYRAMALGAHVTVVTDTVSAWSRLVQSVPRGPAWFTVLPAGSRVTATGTITRPSLVIDATSDNRALPRWEQGQWQTFASVDREITPSDLHVLRTYDLLVTQRLQPTAAEIARRAFGLAPDRATWLTQMPAGVLAVAAPGQLAFGQMTVSNAEQRLLGS
ncbi:hypothetical protein [Tenggerimyces flavus]|uniref:Uncharacterized protein n=1 Tax=Tenggerimyces flavus TaxID=1708749 RepID=A0ABV7YNA4_9ACTN|nr:hypothetical protein [Tenggerimyces flavus]MBM7784506.1 hypothetical protein [Tenggerimyces flavus]